MLIPNPLQPNLWQNICMHKLMIMINELRNLAVLHQRLAQTVLSHLPAMNWCQDFVIKIKPATKKNRLNLPRPSLFRFQYIKQALLAALAGNSLCEAPVCSSRNTHISMQCYPHGTIGAKKPYNRMMLHTHHCQCLSFAQCVHSYNDR